MEIQPHHRSQFGSPCRYTPDQEAHRGQAHASGGVKSSHLLGRKLHDHRQVIVPRRQARGETPRAPRYEPPPVGREKGSPRHGLQVWYLEESTWSAHSKPVRAGINIDRHHHVARQKNSSRPSPARPVPCRQAGSDPANARRFRKLWTITSHFPDSDDPYASSRPSGESKLAAENPVGSPTGRRSPMSGRA